MLRQLLARVQSVIFLRPRAVVLVSLLLLVAAILLGTRVELRKSRTELAPPDDPDQQRWSAVLEQYSGSEALIACVEADLGTGPTPGGLQGFADELAVEFERDPLVAHVFHRFDVEWFRERALYLAAPESLEQLSLQLRDADGTLSGHPGAAGLVELNDGLAARIEQSLESGRSDSRRGAARIEGLVQLLQAQQRFLEEPATAVTAWKSDPGLDGLSGERARRFSDGYMTTYDGETLFLFVTPHDGSDEVQIRRRLIQAMQERVRMVSGRRPGFRVAFTGQPALVVEEMDTIRRDTWITSIAALLGVGALTFMVFRWRTHSVLVLLTIAIGVTWALGAVQLELGYLNLITSSFISTLIGVGVAYAIHPVSEYELVGAHTGDPVANVRESFHRTGAAVAVAAITTSSAFFSILLMRFKGFSELGLVAGVGVLLCLVAAMVTLPAMLLLYGRSRRDRDRVLAVRRPPPVDRLWGPHVAGRICRFPRATTIGALALTVPMAWLASGLGFSTDILDLLPRNAESLRYQEKMLKESDLSMLFNIVVAEDLEGLRAMRERAAEEASIDRFESVLDLLPADLPRTRRLIAELRPVLDAVELPGEVSPIVRADLVAALQRLEQALDLALEDAFGAGMSELVAPLDEARSVAERCRRTVETAPAGAERGWNDGQQELLAAAGDVLDWMRRATVAEPPTLDNLPREIRERFLTRDGRPLGFLFPVESVFDAPALSLYVAGSRRVAREATGFPVVFHKMSGRITGGFYQAVIVGAILVALILLIDYRNPKDAALAMAPLVIGVIWMMGTMRLIGLSFNFANLVAVPLIIGVGIDNGVHIMHRVRFEGREGMGVVLRHTGRAILIASCTTMIGFGSLALASHRGLASLGIVLLLGVGACLVTSTIVLPNLLVALGLVER